MQLEELYSIYGKEKVEEGIAYLSYKKLTPLPKQESDTKPVLYVFRHGQTIDNANFVFSGWRDAELTEKGIEQAKILAEKLKDKNIHMLFASDQTRAVHTMAIAVSLNLQTRNLSIEKDHRLRERSYGDLQGTSKLEAYLKNPEALSQERRNYNYIPPNGESLAMVCTRVMHALEEILKIMKEKNINAAVSCHGNSIRGIRQHFEGLTNEETAQIETPLAQDYASYVI